MPGRPVLTPGAEVPAMAPDLDSMPRTEGTCAACGKDTLVYALGDQRRGVAVLYRVR